MQATRKIKCERVLALTGISQIAPYVINPYRGCGFGCIYCYSQKNKCFKKIKDKWGDFVDIKINCLEVLEKELTKISPKRVLLGSTTEAYQQAEKEYLLTRGVIELLNKYNIPITVLTKSDLIQRDIDILYNAKVCFTMNLHTDKLIRTFEPNSPAIEERIKTVQRLRESGVSVYIHTGPILPGFTDAGKIMEMVSGITDRINFESFNYLMSPSESIDGILKEKSVFDSEDSYNKYWQELKEKIITLNKRYNYKINFFFHPFKEYWISEPVAS